MNDQTKSNFLRYEEIKNEIKSLEEELDTIKPIIIENMQDDDKIEAKNGAFTIQLKKKWKYSTAVINLEADVKDMKKSEEADGTAQFEESRVLFYRANK